MFAHIAVADQKELQQVIVLFLLRTAVGVERHANSGALSRQVIGGSRSTTVGWSPEFCVAHGADSGVQKQSV